MATKRNRHYSVEEKTDIICKRIGFDCFERNSARKVAEAIDHYTFMMLDELVKAIKEIAKGND